MLLVWVRLREAIQCTHLPICFSLLRREAEGSQWHASWQHVLRPLDDTVGVVCIHRNGSRKVGRKKHTFGSSFQSSHFHYSINKETSLACAGKKPRVYWRVKNVPEMSNIFSSYSSLPVLYPGATNSNIIHRCKEAKLICSYPVGTNMKIFPYIHSENSQQLRVQKKTRLAVFFK